MKKDITEYLDYRDFLYDLYMEIRKEKPYFSYRYIQYKTNIDASHIAKIFAKKRHLPEKSIPHIVKLFNLNEFEEKYLRLLRNYNKAKTEKEAKLFYDELLSLQNIKLVQLRKDQFEYYTKWYYTAILVLLDFYKFKDNYKELANILTPPISVTEAKKSIKLLERLELIKKDNNGYYVPTNKIITSGDTTGEVAIKNYQREVIKMAYEALYRHKKEDRDISTITISINKKELSNIREIIKKFRHTLLKLSNETKDPNIVYQLNVQFFPLTQEVKND